MSMVVTSLPSAAAICAMMNMAVVETVGEEVSEGEYFPLSWQSPPPTSRALTLSLILPVPSVREVLLCHV